MKTATTPGTFMTPSTSTETMFAWACVLRANATCSAPGIGMSSV